MIPHATESEGSEESCDARDSNCGLEALHGPHQVAEKVIRVEGWVERKVVRSDGEESSCSVMVVSLIFDLALGFVENVKDLGFS